jgi:hypothetical protein
LRDAARKNTLKKVPQKKGVSIMIKRSTVLLTILFNISTIHPTARRPSSPAPALTSIIRQRDMQTTAQYDSENNSSKKTAKNCSCAIQTRIPSDQCKLDISFGIADIKFDTNSLKILELGEGTRSMFAGYESLYGEGTMWKKIWHFLFQQSNALASNTMPRIFFVDEELHVPTTRKSVALMELMRRGDVAVATLDELEQHPIFIQTQNIPSPHVTTNTERPPAGLVVIRHDAADEEHITKFLSHTHNLLLCNAAIAPFVNNKKSTDSLFFGPLLIHRPYSKIVPKKHAATNASQILVESRAQEFVIKPLTGSKGEGVIFTTRKNLATTLASLFGPHQRGPCTKSEEELYWLNDDNQEVLIESCERSKPVTVAEKQYDATLRVIYGLTHAHHAVTATILGCYWKLPAKSLDAACSLQEKKLSRITGRKNSSAPVSPEDEAEIQATFLPLIATLYDQMLPTQGTQL